MRDDGQEVANEDDDQGSRRRRKDKETRRSGRDSRRHHRAGGGSSDEREVRDDSERRSKSHRSKKHSKSSHHRRDRRRSRSSDEGSERRRSRHQRRDRSNSSDLAKQRNEVYELYKKKKREKQLEAEKIAAAKLQGIDVHSKPRKVSFEDFPNFKRKLVVQNIPLSQSESDIMQFFFGILTTTATERYNKNPIMSVHRYEGLGFVTLEFRKRDDAEVCLNLDGTEYSSSNHMRIMRVKRFMD